MPDLAFTWVHLILFALIIFGPPVVFTFLAGVLASVLVSRKAIGRNLLASTLAGIVGSLVCVGSFAWAINRYSDRPQGISALEMALPQVVVGALFGVFTIVGIFCVVKFKRDKGSRRGKLNEAQTEVS